MKQVRQTIEQFHMLQPQDRVLLGVSGGPDSIMLLHLLNEWKMLYGIQLYVVHVNHQLREEAEEEAAYVQQLAQAMQIPCQIVSVDVAAYAVAHKMSFEQAGHAVRFSCFQKAAAQWQITKLALGHHRDDRAESVLMHLIKGCGLDGLTAMPPKDGWLIRPLAQISKQQIIEYCQEQGWRYYIDQTNLEADCLRNKIRLELLPQLQQYNPEVAAALVRMQEICGADEDYLEQCTLELWRQYGQQTADAVGFPALQLCQQHKALQRRLLRVMYQKLTGSSADLTFEQTEQILRLSLQQQGSQQYDLANGVQFFRQYDQLGMQWRCDKSDGYRYCWNLQDTVTVAQWPCKLTAIFTESKEELYQLREQNWTQQPYMQVAVDGAKLANIVEVRSRLPGDQVQPLGMQGHKKLKNFFIDKKVPAMERGKIPLIQSFEEIIWIPGYFLAECVKITEATKQFCLLQCFRQ